MSVWKVMLVNPVSYVDVKVMKVDTVPSVFVTSMKLSVLSSLRCHKMGHNSDKCSETVNFSSCYLCGSKLHTMKV